MATGPNTALDGRPMQVIVLANPDGTLQTPGSIINTTSPQLTVGYDASDKLTVGVSAAGATTFTAAGSAPSLIFTGAPTTFSQNGALSAPAVTVNGTWVSGGSATTTKPLVLIEPSGTASTAWSTSGTGLGINAATGFTGNLLDLQLAAASKFSVSSAGVLTTASGFAVTGDSMITGALRATANSTIGGAGAVNYAALFLQKTLTVSAASSLYTNSTLTPGGNTQSVYNGYFADDISAGTRTSTTSYGVLIGGTFSNGGSGSHISQSGLSVAPTYAASSAGAATNYGINVGVVSGGATNNYGVYIAAPTGTGNIGLYNAGTSTLVGLVTASAGVSLAASQKIGAASGVVGHSVVSTAYTLGTGGTVVLPNVNMSGAANDAARDVLAGNIDGAIAIDTGVAGRIYIRDAGAWKFALAT